VGDSLPAVTVALVLATASLVVALVSLERTGMAWRLPVKALASTGFVAVALATGALDTLYGQWVLVGLCLAWVGDVLLALPGRRAFLGGLVAFLLGHVGYVIAFGVRGFGSVVVGVAAMGVAVTAVVVWRWLRPHLDAAMVGPVAAYVVVISMMVVAAFATAGSDLDVRIVAGAVLFHLSDLFVARQRFVAPGAVNRVVGLPMYYAAQILVALSVG
jgi:uncharacterized membrane protein YhhN